MLARSRCRTRGARRAWRAALAALVLACAHGPASGEPRPLLIAHRGGIVDVSYAENSPGAIEAAVARGYHMVELDVRESRDGRLVVHHDEDFRRFYSDERLLADLTWDEIRQLRAQPGDTRPMLFREAAELCAGRIEVMLDTKPPEHDEAFYGEMESALRDNGLLENALVIGTPESRGRFLGKALVGVPGDVLQRAAEGGEDVASRYYLFEHGRDLDAAGVRAAQELGVIVVPSINVGHYEDLPDHRAPAESDLRRMRELDVQYFQIDSVYDSQLLD